MGKSFTRKKTNYLKRVVCVFLLITTLIFGLAVPAFAVLPGPLDQWTSRTSGISGDLKKVTWGNNTFVAVGWEPGKILTSPDGVTWTSNTSGTSNDLYRVTWGNNTFVAVGDSGTILTSPTGETWTSRTSGTSNRLFGVTWGNNTFVAVGMNGTILTSPNGVDWTNRTSGTSVILAGVTYGNGTFVAVGNTGTIITSLTGETWTSSTSGTTMFLADVTWGNNTFVAVGWDPGKIFTSPDGENWSIRNSGINNDLLSVSYGNNTFVATGNAGTILSSPTGEIWTVRRTVESSGTLYGVTCGNNTFVAVGEAGEILQSGNLVLAITTDSLPAGTVGMSYSTTLAANYGFIPYTWSASGLPEGLNINSVTGEVSGTPTTAGTSTIQLTVTDSYSASVSKELSLVIAQPTAITGIVTDGASPVEGAVVSLSVNSIEYSSSTAADGTYTITGIPAGIGYTVTASKTGYYDGSTTTDVTVNTTTSGVDFTLQKKILTVGTGGGYSSLAGALSAAADGDTITLLNDITESVSYTAVTGKTITIDGQNFTITGESTDPSTALTLNGDGVVILKNLNLLGGHVYHGYGLQVSGTVSVQSIGTVTATGDGVAGGMGMGNGYGLMHSGSGIVNVTTANGGGGGGAQFSFGIRNTGAGTVNAGAAEGAIMGAGVSNESTGTVNVNSATGGNNGIINGGTGTVNAATATGAFYGVTNNSTGTVNVTTPTGGTDSISNNSGTVHIGDDVATLTLNKGTGASCVLNAITVAKTGSTTIGALPGVYKDGVEGSWYTDTAKTVLFSGTTVTAATTLYSSFADVPVATPAIAGVTAPVTGAVPTAVIADTAEYTATISWNGSPSTFAAGTVYTATITITPKTGYTTTGVAANFFTVAGAAATNAADSGVVTAVFPATSSLAIATPAIAGVTAPVTGAVPTAAIAATAEYTATISWNGSPSTFAAGTVYTATITITPKTGYTTTGVAANFFTVAGATSVTNAVNSGVITAIFPATAAAASHNDGGSGGYSPPPVTPPAAPVTITETPPTGNTTPSVTSTTTTEAKSDSNGNAAAAVTESQITDAVNKAVTAAAQKGKDTAAKVEIKVTVPADAKSVETSIPKASFNAVADSKIDSLTVSTPIASITFDDKSLDTISKEAAGDVKITASKVDTSTLSEGTKQVVGDRPVFNFSVTCGDKTISQFGGNVEVSVPYTPKAGEDTSAIVIYYINAEGKLEIVSNCAYDPATGTIRFKTSHFSQYAVGYNKVSFKDVAVTAWYNNAVSFIAARGITTGTGNGNYSPEAKLTRGEFLVMMMRAYGIDADANPRDNFKDAGSTYYTGYLAAAKRLGITNGEGNNLFAPDKEITRQDMFTLLYNALKVIDKLPEGTAGRDLSSFSDSGEISSWAKDAMTLFIKTGTVTGSSGKLSPTSKTTRAEMAQVLFTLLSK